MKVMWFLIIVWVRSTCVAAVNTNRHYIGFELDEQYFDIACQRLDEVEGETK